MRCRTSNYTVCTAKALSARADVRVRDTQSAQAGSLVGQPSSWLPQSLGLFRFADQHSSTGIAFFPFAASAGDYLYLYFNSPLFKRLSAPDGDGSGQRPAMGDA